MLETTILISVNSSITSEGMVYPLNKSNEPETHNGIHISDCTDEWMESLSENDYNRAINRGFETCMHGNSWNSECDECDIDEYSDDMSDFDDTPLVDVGGYLL